MEVRQLNRDGLEPRPPRFGPAIVVAIYVCVAGAYIFLSDWLTSVLVSDINHMWMVQTIKGMLFIFVTGLLLYVLVRAAVQQAHAFHAKLEAGAAELRRITATVPGIVIQSRIDAKGIWSFPFVSNAIESVFGLTPAQVAQDPMSMFRTFDPRDVEHMNGVFERARRDLAPTSDEFRIITPSGQHKWIRIQSVASRTADGATLFHMVLFDVTEEKRRESLREEQASILRMLMAGAPIQQVLEAIAHLAESQTQDLRCTILLVDDERKQLRCGTAPSMDAECVKRIDGIPIGPGSGVCGTAAYINKLVICENTFTDPACQPYLELLSQYELRSCWSVPIARKGEHVLGTLAFYHRKTRVPTESEIKLAGEIADLAAVVISQKRSEEALRDSEDRYRSIIEDQTEFICRFLPDGSIVFANDAFCRFFEFDPRQHQSQNILRLMDIEDEHKLTSLLRTLTRSEPVGHFEHKMSSSNRHECVISWTCRALFDDDSHVVRYQAVGNDVTALSDAQSELLQINHRQTLLLDELDHRVKNSLAGLLSLITLSEHEARSVDDLATSIRGRVQTMSATHSLLSASHWRAVDLESLLHRLTPGETRGSVSFDGPPVAIPARQVTAMGMIAQELMTNSVKYGGLSSETGTVAVQWSSEELPDARRILRLLWTERGGPPIHTPIKPRLGISLINGFTRSELGGEPSLNFEPVGVRHEFLFRLDQKPTNPGSGPLQHERRHDFAART